MNETDLREIFNEHLEGDFKIWETQYTDNDGFMANIWCSLQTSDAIKQFVSNYMNETNEKENLKVKYSKNKKTDKGALNVEVERN